MSRSQRYDPFPRAEPVEMCLLIPTPNSPRSCCEPDQAWGPSQDLSSFISLNLQQSGLYWTYTSVSARVISKRWPPTRPEPQQLWEDLTSGETLGQIMLMKRVTGTLLKKWWRLRWTWLEFEFGWICGVSGFGGLSVWVYEVGSLMQGRGVKHAREGVWSGACVLTSPLSVFCVWYFSLCEKVLSGPLVFRGPLKGLSSVQLKKHAWKTNKGCFCRHWRYPNNSAAGGNVGNIRLIMQLLYMFFYR